MSFHFRSFRARIVTFVIGLLVLVQGAVLLAVHTANVNESRRHVDEALELTASAFRRSLESREQILLEKARLLSADFAFKEASATGDRATLLSALENHRARVGAAVMMLLDLDGEARADTLHPEAAGPHAPFPSLLEKAMESEFGEASAIEFLDGTAYQMVVVPLFTPEPSAWIAIGFAIRDDFALELQEETSTHVSLLRRGAGAWRTVCSTLAPPLRRAIEASLSERVSEARRIFTMSLVEDEYVSWVAPVESGGVGVVAVLQRSLDEALLPFMRLRTILLAVFALGVALSVAGGILLSTRVTRPVANLARAARRVARGQYAERVEVAQRDELGTLAASFNNMMKGLAERDRIRDLLGKVVSREIAEELLRKEIELGGEERTVSVLFTDIRGFTRIAETEDPQRLVAILNTYLTRVSAIVESHGGVVEEYMGDGVKALFGAPLQHEDDASRAVRTALELCAGLPEINREIEGLGGRPIAIGAGIHTGTVVAGNMGSPSRLKYTAVGDGVNLASRLEGLTRRYGVPAIVSQSTREACPGLVFRELDRVRVKGRETPVTVYEPVGAEGEVEPALRELLALHDEALQRFRGRDWDGAEALFRELGARAPTPTLHAVYLERIARLRAAPPGRDWDGTVTYEEK